MQLKILNCPKAQENRNWPNAGMSNSQVGDCQPHIRCDGLVVARLPAAQEGPGSNRAADKSLCFSRKSLRYAASGTDCTLIAVPWSTHPSTLRGTVNEYQPYGWVIIPMTLGECSAYSSLQSDSKVNFTAWPTSWRPPGTDRLWPRWTTVNSRIWLAP